MTEEQKMSAAQQRAYEQAFQKHNEHMFKTTCAYLKSIEHKNNYLMEIDQNSDEFLQFVGSCCYLIGLDFYTTTYANKKVMANVTARLQDCIFATEENFNKEMFISNLIAVVKDIDDKKFEELYQRYIDAVNKPIPMNEYNSVGMINTRFHRIMSGSSINVSYAKSISELLNKKTAEITYKDILTINNTICDYLEYNKSRTMDEFSAMYTDEKFRNLLKQAAVKYDRLKFGTLFNESVVSCKELILSGRYSEDEIVKLLTNEYTDEQFEAAEAKHQEDIKSQAEENKEKEQEQPTIYQQHVGDISQLMKTDPMYAFMIIVHEQFGERNMDNADDFIKGLETIADNPDYIGQVYHYVQSIRRKVTTEDDIKEYKDNAIFDGLLEKMEEKIQQQRLQYKEQTEFMCQDIEKELCVKINRQINNLIKCMVLSTNEEKQYLISQINYPGVKTVKHLTEMMGVIEKGKMNAAPESIAEYTKLFDLVRSNLGEVLDKIADENPVQDKLALFMATKDLLTNFLGKKEEEKKEETPSESENK